MFAWSSQNSFGIVSMFAWSLLPDEVSQHPQADSLVCSGRHFQTSAACVSRQNPVPTSCSSSEDPEPAGGVASLSSSKPLPVSPADNPTAQLPNPLLSLAHTPTLGREALVSGLSSVTSSTVAAARFVVWFLSGQYIPSRLRVLITLLRAERYYRKHILTIDPQQLLHELNFLPELPSFEALFPALAYAAVLLKAIGGLVPALGSFSLLQGSAGVPGLPEVDLPTVGPSTAYEYPDKSDQPSTPGYKPLGEWIGPRGMKPWERNAVTISKEERKKLWDKNFKEYTLQPFNSTHRERKALVILAAISTTLTWMWILLHALLVPLLFIGLMVTIEKPLFWVLGQLYKLRRFVGGFRGPMYSGG
jgi:hypothetical protein